jgi:hypothetical protein
MSNVLLSIGRIDNTGSFARLIPFQAALHYDTSGLLRKES